jgi:hypothetical protein
MDRHLLVSQVNQVTHGIGRDVRSVGWSCFTPWCMTARSSILSVLGERYFLLRLKLEFFHSLRSINI